MKTRIFCIFASLVSVSQIAVSIKTLDVQPYINQMEERLEGMVKPSPEIVEEFVQQLQASCKTNRSIDLSMMYNMSSCMDDLFNQTSLVTELKEAIPKGNLDLVFRNLCLKWPEMKSCMQEGLEVINECWGTDNGNQLMRGMDTFVGFFCGADNDGSRIALFIAEDGIKCLDTFGRFIGECLIDQASENSAHSLCVVIEHLHQCLPILKKCTNVTPENLISSVVRHVSKVIECAPLEKPTYVYPDHDEPSVFDSLRNFQASLTKLLEDHADLHKFDTGLKRFAAECEKKGVNVNFKELEEGTKNCSNLTIIEPNYAGFTSFQRSRISTTCSVVVQSARCLAPYRDLLLKCSEEGFVALTLGNELCQNNASVIQGSINREVLQCFQRRSTWSTFRKCTATLNSGNETYSFIENMQSDFCRTLSMAKNCGLETLSMCRSPQPRMLLTEFLNTVEVSETHVRNCLAQQNAGVSRVRIPDNGFIIPIQLILLLMLQIMLFRNC